MAKLELKIRRLETDEVLVAEFDGIDDALTWLAQRPPLVEVVRVVSEIDEATETKLRQAMRPFDDDERDFLNKKDFEREMDRRQELRRLQAEATGTSTASGSGDAARPMALMFVRGQGLTKTDADDDRDIPEAARRVIDHWLRERDGWLHERRQHLAKATFSVWPASVPSGSESDRILEADFAAMPGLSDVEI